VEFHDPSLNLTTNNPDIAQLPSGHLQLTVKADPACTRRPSLGNELVNMSLNSFYTLLFSTVRRKMIPRNADLQLRFSVVSNWHIFHDIVIENRCYANHEEDDKKI